MTKMKNIFSSIPVMDANLISELELQYTINPNKSQGIISWTRTSLNFFAGLLPEFEWNCKSQPNLDLMTLLHSTKLLPFDTDIGWVGYYALCSMSVVRLMMMNDEVILFCDSGRNIDIWVQPSISRWHGCGCGLILKFIVNAIAVEWGMGW